MFTICLMPCSTLTKATFLACLIPFWLNGLYYYCDLMLGHKTLNPKNLS